MPLSCHRALQQVKSQTDLTLALIGNPNVGKSSLFNHLTGLGVITANYPGKTVEMNLGTSTLDSLRLGIMDLPGIYALDPISEDQWVARQALLEGGGDAVIVLVDATNLARNLYLALQLLDLGLPLVVALNLTDEAEERGIRIDAPRLAELLGVPVVPTVAVRGQGVRELMEEAVEVAQGKSAPQRRPHYGADVEEAISRLAGAVAAVEGGVPYRLAPAAVAVLLMEEDRDFASLLEGHPGGPQALALARQLAQELEERHGEAAPTRIARERHGLAGEIASQVQHLTPQAEPLADRLRRYATSPLSGLLILALVLAGLFLFLFIVGGWLAEVFGNAWAAYASPLIQAPVYFLLGDTPLARTLLWGLDSGIQAILSVGIPYVLTFYFLLALLEDTGYLSCIAFLMDWLMHRFGLHGRAIIPLVAGAGCNVPAIIGTRVLQTPKERLIASTLIVLVPCSARTAVILGGASRYLGWGPALAVYLLDLALIVVVGLAMERTMKGSSAGLVMEMFPFRLPRPALLAQKTWLRLKAFLFVATPIVLVGSLVLGGLYETGLIWYLAQPMAPLVQGWLGLPAVAGLTLLFAVLRKELALQLLVSLAIMQYGREATNLLMFMSPPQLFVYTLVNTIYIPCIATIAVLGAELGWKRGAAITAFTVGLAVFLGGLVYRVLLWLW